MNVDINTLSNELIASVETIMDPNTSHDDRAHANRICEDFKKSPHCIQCGLCLYRKGESPFVRHFGLHLLEHCIKFNWNTMVLEDRGFVKNSVFDLMANGTKGILNEELHIKRALAHIVVEIIKREWPQQWPSLLEELHTLCTLGESQTELVLLIFMILAEETVIHQSYPVQRRKEVLMTIEYSLPHIFPFFFRTFKTHYLKFQEAQRKKELEKQEIYGRLVETVVNTLGNGYLQFCSMIHLALEDYALLTGLIFLLKDNRFRMAAVECLFNFVSRKEKAQNGLPYLVMFKEEHMDFICSVSSSCLAESYTTPEEESFKFLNKLCQIHTCLGAQLVVIWGVIDQWEIPSSFQKYIQILLAYTRHPSQVLSDFACKTWKTFLKHKNIPSYPVMIECMPDLLEACKFQMSQIDNPPNLNDDSTRSKYSKLDLMRNEESQQYQQYLADILKNVTIHNPKLAFGYCAKNLYAQMKKTIADGPGNADTYKSLFYLEWDGLSLFLESVLSSKPKDSTADVLSLLEAFLNCYKFQHSLISPVVITCITNLFLYLAEDATVFLPSILEKIFNFGRLNFPDDPASKTIIDNLKHDPCAALVKMCKYHPELLLPSFQEIRSQVEQVPMDSDERRTMRKSALYEALILLCNQHQHYGQQFQLIREMCSPVQKTWIQLKKLFSSEKLFLSVIGLDRAPSTDVKQITLRSEINFCLSFFLAVVKTSKWPAIDDVAVNNGFLREVKDDSSHSYRNPATPYVLPVFIMEPLFGLIRVLNTICTPESRSHLHPEFAKVLDVREDEASYYTGSSSQSFGRNANSPNICEPWQKMQLFLSRIFEQCYNILGHAGESLGVDFYCYPKLCDAILNSVLVNLEYQPTIRLRIILQTFIKPFILHCPPHLKGSIVVPFLGALCPLVFKLLNKKWKSFNEQHRISSEFKNKMTEKEEILEDEANRIFTWEFIFILGANLLSSGHQNDSMEVFEEPVSSSAREFLSELGVQLLAQKNLRATLVVTLFSALHWDSFASMRSAQICEYLLRQLNSEDAIQSGHEARYVMQSIIQGLKNFGEHTEVQIRLLHLATQAYILLWPKIPGFENMMLEITGCSPDALKVVDHQLFTVDKYCSDKKKRQHFNPVVAGVIGMSVSGLHLETIEIKNLTPMV